MMLQESGCRRQRCDKVVEKCTPTARQLGSNDAANRLHNQDKARAHAACLLKGNNWQAVSRQRHKQHTVHTIRPLPCRKNSP